VAGREQVLLQNGEHALPLDTNNFDEYLKTHDYTFVNFVSRVTWLSGVGLAFVLLAVPRSQVRYKLNSHVDGSRLAYLGA
jgi:hypothetical protein